MSVPFIDDSGVERDEPVYQVLRLFLAVRSKSQEPSISRTVAIF